MRLESHSNCMSWREGRHRFAQEYSQLRTNEHLIIHVEIWSCSRNHLNLSGVGSPHDFVCANSSWRHLMKVILQISIELQSFFFQKILILHFVNYFLDFLNFFIDFFVLKPYEGKGFLISSNQVLPDLSFSAVVISFVFIFLTRKHTTLQWYFLFQFDDPYMMPSLNFISWACPWGYFPMRLAFLTGELSRLPSAGCMGILQSFEGLDPNKRQKRNSLPVFLSHCLSWTSVFSCARTAVYTTGSAGCQTFRRGLELSYRSL